MMKEEKILKEKVGAVCHFSVPDGYFDSFAEKLMEQLPETEAHVIPMHAESWHHRMQWRKVAAAVAAVVLLGGGSMVFWGQIERKPARMTAKFESHVQPSSSEYATFEQMADYAMVDNQDIYASLVAEN